MTSAQVVETSVNVISNSPSQDYTHPDDRTSLNDLFSLFITTVVVPLSSFLRIISLLLISSLRARSSPGGRLFLGLTSGVPQALF